MFYIGIDVSKDSFHFCILHSTEKRVILSKNFTMDSQSFQKLLNYLSTYSPNHIILESSGRFHIPLLAFLCEKGLSVSLLNPKVIYHFNKFLSATNPSKSDKKDALTLALFALSNPHLLQPASLPSETKLLARHIQKLKHELSETKIQIKHSLSVLFPEAEKHFNIFSQSFLYILSHYPSAKKIAISSPEKINSILPQSKGRKPSLSIPDLIKLAKNSIGVPNKGLEISLKFYIKKLLFLQSEIQKMEKELQKEIETFMSDQIKFLSSVKGISPNLAAQFLAEIENINRFSNAKKLIKYAGTDPVTKQSGKWEVQMSISKKGNPFLRNILFQMAVGVVTWNKVFRMYFRKKYAQFGSYKKAMIAVVNKLVRVIYALCSRKQFFNPSKLINPAMKVSHA